MLLKNLKIYILFAFIMTFVFNMSVTETYACSCVQPGSPSEELNKSTAVFSGKVIEIVDENKNPFFQSSADTLKIRFTVIETWKGNVESEVIVKTARYSDSCGFEFALNEDYLVYANETNGNFHVSLCSRTASLATASSDLNELGTGEIPPKKTNSNIDDSNSFNVPIVIALLILLFIVIIVGFLFLRRGKK